MCTQANRWHVTAFSALQCNRGPCATNVGLCQALRKRWDVPCSVTTQLGYSCHSRNLSGMFRRLCAARASTKVSSSSLK